MTEFNYESFSIKNSQQQKTLNKLILSVFSEVASRQISNELVLEIKKLADTYDYLVENGNMFQ